MKTFLSIGTGPGNGFATAERFARGGFRTILASRNLQKTQALANKLVNKGFAAKACCLDVSHDEAIAAIISEIEVEFQKIDVVHYNVASLRNQDLNEQPGNTFNTDLAVNVGGAMSMIKAVSPFMLERQEGTILLTGGSLAINPDPEFLSLSVGKAGLRALAQALFLPFKNKGVHIANLNITQKIQPDSPEADAVGEHFWKLYNQSRTDWTAEAIY